MGGKRGGEFANQLLQKSCYDAGITPTYKTLPYGGRAVFNL